MSLDFNKQDIVVAQSKNLAVVVVMFTYLGLHFGLIFSLLKIFGTNGTMECIPANKILKFNPSTLEEVRKYWNLDNRRIVQSVDILEDWMSKQDHFVNKKFSRSYLERTLITCKGSVEKTKSQIDNLCTFKTLLPRFFFSGDVGKFLADISNTALILPLPKLTKDNYRMAIIRINPKELTSDQFIFYYRFGVIICEYLKAHDYANGFIIVYDLMDSNLVDIMTKINIVEFQHLVTLLIEGYGARCIGVYVLSKSSTINLLVKTIKPMISRKLADRIHVKQEIEELHSVVDKEILPVEYGGEEKSIEILKNEWLDVLSSEENEKYLAEMMESCTDETLRSSSKFNEQVMGLPGSFRTLSVD